MLENLKALFRGGNGSARENPDHSLVLVVIAVPAVLGLGCLVLFVYPSWKAFGAAALLAGASFTSGSLLGLLFGIPRIGRAADDAQESEHLHPVNNNLVQVSNWLTNVLLGATLTQVANVPGALSGFGAQYGKEVGSPAVAVFTLVHFLVAGFLAGYLLTRVILHGTFHRAVKFPEQSSKGGAPTRETNPPPKRDQTIDDENHGDEP